jgi:hypothetical protein
LIVALIGGLSGTVATYIVSGKQQVRAQQAINADQGAWDAATPALRVENAQAETDYSYTSAETVDLTGKPYTNPGPVLAGAGRTGVGQLLDDEPQTTTQPTVRGTISFTIIGQHYEPVQILEVKARVISRSPPLAGTLVYIESQGGAESAKMGIDLDSVDLSARTTGGKRATNRKYFQENYITLNRGERVGLDVSVFTRKCLCRFFLDVKVSDGTVFTVDDKGRPWQISGFAPSYARSFIPYILANPAGPHFVSCVWAEDCQDYYSRHRAG